MLKEGQTGMWNNLNLILIGTQKDILKKRVLNSINPVITKSMPESSN